MNEERDKGRVFVTTEKKMRILLMWGILNQLRNY